MLMVHTSIQTGTTTSTSIAYKYNPDNDTATVKTYGYLYNWRAAMGKSPSSNSDPSGVQGPCPNGWHVPSDTEWTILTNYVSSQPAYHFSTTATYIAKSLAANANWNNYTNGTIYDVGNPAYPNNATGFSA